MSDAVSDILERVERRLDSIATERRRDFRWLLGIMLGGFGMTVGGFASLLLVLAHGFHWL